MIYVANRNKIKVQNSKSGQGFVWIQTQHCVYFSCYISPNKDGSVFKPFLNLAKELKYHAKKEIIVSGHAKAPLWDFTSRDNRGESLEELIAEHNLLVINEGKVGMLASRHQGTRGKSFIDVTLASTKAAKDITDWEVDADDENLSEHNNIFFTRIKQSEKRDSTQTTNRWRINADLKLNPRLLAHTKRTKTK